MSALVRIGVKFSKIFRESTVSFAETSSKWFRTIGELSRQSKELAEQFRNLPLRRVTDVTGKEIVHVGALPGHEFAAMLRAGASVRAFEMATGKLLSNNARLAFREFDAAAAKTLPDARVFRRDEFVNTFRNTLREKGILRDAVVKDAQTLEIMIRGDARLTGEASRLTRLLRHTKTILFLGGVMTVAGLGIAGLCRAAERMARGNTGCFIYITDEYGVVRKYKIRGCSCPLSVAVNDTKTIVPVWPENQLPTSMRVTNTACDINDNGEGSASNVAKIRCVHCDWKETDPHSINFVEKNAFPDNAFVRCEQMDALDAFLEMVGQTADDTWKTVEDVNKGVSNSLSTLFKIIPLILGAIVTATLIITGVFIYRLINSTRRDIVPSHVIKTNRT